MKEKRSCWEKESPARKSDTAKSAKRVVAMAPFEGWKNVELVKDCGLIPYLLYKNHGHDVSMVGMKLGEYPYHEQYTKGVKMEFLSNGGIMEKLQYIEKQAKEIDGLLLYGCHCESYKVVAETYKRLNANGRIFLALDANSVWMDYILWDEEDFKSFMDCCDVIATSCHAMQDHLNEKWPWKIECVPNGYYAFSPQVQPVFSEKENTILTVGRLGTEQKATHVLLEAFAKIADQIPDWKMRLVGSVEQSFGAFRENYFRDFPELLGRVQFVGTIADREQLFEEYRKAKIFALSSVIEGGTPNVIAEALHGGCAIAVTRFDAYEDATDSGLCGASAPVGDVDGFSQILKELCTRTDLKQLSRHAYEYSYREFDMEKIVARVNELLWR